MPTLRELEAVFVGRYKTGGSFYEQGDVMAGAQGLLFDCPLTRHVCEGRAVPPGTRPCHGHSIIVWFANAGVPAEAHPAYRWTASGTGLDDLTLTPSINLDIPWVDAKGVQHPSSCSWHGFVTRGVASPP